MNYKALYEIMSNGSLRLAWFARTYKALFEIVSNTLHETR
jgi:hypothetical protein